MSAKPVFVPREARIMSGETGLMIAQVTGCGGHFRAQARDLVFQFRDLPVEPAKLSGLQTPVAR